jgi:CubicO group peptidase (beta-lactamase class C family)
MKAVKHAVFFLLVLVAIPRSASAGEMPSTLPEEVGLSGPKLQEVKKVVQGLVDQKEFAGAVTMVARRGKVVQVNAVGMMDIEAGKPMKPDTIFRIYSMTKPVTTVAAMMLYEEGKLQLDDPVSKYIPELKGLRVQAPKGSDTVEAKREMTIRDLMRHTSGLTYGFFGGSAVDKLYLERKVLDPQSDLQAMVTKLGKIPLLSQPGTRWQYSVSTDVLGRLVEVVSGKSLDAFFEEQIFKPLDMKDSGFFVPEGKVERFSVNYSRGEKGALKANDVPAKSSYLKRPKLLSGGGGLVSTARDYTRFCQMLLDGGELQGTRLLKKETVQLMSSNQLPDEAMPLSLPGIKLPTKGLGFGLGFAVLLEAAGPGSAGTAGEYFWGGAASTNFYICPKQDLVIVAMTQFMPVSPKLGEAFKKGVYESLLDKSAGKKTDAEK